MNARERAIEEAGRYWRERGFSLDHCTLEARQVPLPGSVWWVEAHATGMRRDLLVYRMDKATFRCEPHWPYGYTVYACHKGCETPLEVVEYEAQAHAMLTLLQQSPLYTHTSLCFVANPSAEWAEATRALLTEKAQRREGRQQQKVDRKWGISQLLHYRVVEQATGQPAEEESKEREPYPQDVFNALEAAVRAKSRYYSVHHRARTQAFLASRMRTGVCQPFGWLWTESECLLLTPGDAISQQSLFASQRWKRVKHFFYFDGKSLQECASHEKLKQLLGFDY
ncbi:hypothetical protein KDA_74830 [Dictyobacter alpinus]|uniref:Uncharacterized protein n=1 Tax=Dictyobacter alpinus TaxID=2014873 RepID=A0A402BKZ9_9CHLR|nr:hypothetical protein [Dictyobacter alpinus]GCE31999.1 hypothetical protein KDA_74830 [Dictyobacter alpinus]